MNRDQALKMNASQWRNYINNRAREKREFSIVQGEGYKVFRNSEYLGSFPSRYEAERYVEGTALLAGKDGK